MLLDSLDKLNEDGSTGVSNIFKKAKELGFITSSDLVSENQNHESTAWVAFPYIDYLFMNDYEAEYLTKCRVFENDYIQLQELEKMIDKIF